MKSMVALGVVALAAAVGMPNEAKAANYYIHCTYEVQVEIRVPVLQQTRWKTVLETSDAQEATLMYDALVLISENDELHEVIGFHPIWHVPTGRVRLIQQCTFYSGVQANLLLDRYDLEPLFKRK